MSVGGPAIPVSVVASGAPVRGGAAIPCYGYLPSNVDRPIEGGPARPVYLVTAADIAAGKYVVAGNTQPVPMCAVTDGRAVAAGPAVPVYVAAGALR